MSINISETVWPFKVKKHPCYSLSTVNMAEYVCTLPLGLHAIKVSICEINLEAPLKNTHYTFHLKNTIKEPNKYGHLTSLLYVYHANIPGIMVL